MIDVSIIIVNYNLLDILDNCLKSLENFTTGINYEVIVIDNCTTTGKVEDVTCKYKNTVLIKNNTNIGFAAANNQGAKIAKGKYLLILNNDVLFIENSVKKVLQYAESLKEEVIIGCKLLNADNSLQISISAFPNVLNSITENYFLYKLFPKSSVMNKYHLNYKNLTETTEVDIVKGAFLFCSKKSYLSLSGFDERFYFYSEETDFCYRFKNEIGNVLYYPDTSIIHLGGATTDRDLWFKYKNQTIGKIQIYQKHFKGFDFFISVFSHYSGLMFRFILYMVGGIFGLNKSLIKKSYYFFKQIFVYPKNVFNLS